MTILDILPRNLDIALDDLVQQWLPYSWIPHESKASRLFWANIFARGGFVEVDGTLNQCLNEKPCWGNGLGTFAKIDTFSWFVWVDDDGRHWFKFPNYSPWESRDLKAIFKRCLGSHPDFTKDKWASRAMELVDTLETLRKGAVSGQALGLFGGAVTLR